MDNKTTFIVFIKLCNFCWHSMGNTIFSRSRVVCIHFLFCALLNINSSLKIAHAKTILLLYMRMRLCIIYYYFCATRLIIIIIIMCVTENHILQHKRARGKEKGFEIIIKYLRVHAIGS